MDSNSKMPAKGEYVYLTTSGLKVWGKKLGIVYAGSVAEVLNVRGSMVRVRFCQGNGIKNVRWPTPHLLASQHGVCCRRCGGMNVEFTVWHNPNTGVTGEAFGSWNAGDNTFCNDCEDNTDLVDGGSEPEEFIAARQKHAAMCVCDDDNCGETPCLSKEGSDA